ncbi:uncharacterized protein BO96DRAFT_464181 [Aspergillus niger CBS 101883]|uniref:uncharacterized protein n=1 Tax=Aspergillus lacticoffeatus (strain CBS 101883) TaxID=1450533 RepID=UPI000D7EBB52|nr:uncharacterized protein BO96DRAFT_464181 [Aspergillus niger CBS 101883]PYH58777.1 hypothetical protein BO96DRAFT_464181 [Aspergillus niger CBS 101883]
MTAICDGGGGPPLLGQIPEKTSPGTSRLNWPYLNRRPIRNANRGIEISLVSLLATFSLLQYIDTKLINLASQPAIPAMVDTSRHPRRGKAMQLKHPAWESETTKNRSLPNLVIMVAYFKKSWIRYGAWSTYKRQVTRRIAYNSNAIQLPSTSRAYYDRKDVSASPCRGLDNSITSNHPRSLTYSFSWEETGDPELVGAPIEGGADDN